MGENTSIIKGSAWYLFQSDAMGAYQKNFNSINYEEWFKKSNLKMSISHL